MDKKSLVFKLVITIIIIATLVVIAYLFLQNRNQTEKINFLTAELNRAQLENDAAVKAFLAERESASSTITELSERLSLTSAELADIESVLNREKNKNDDFEDQIKKISGTVGVLDKLSKTDKELLQKYSRTYFLNENFVPMKLKQVDTRYVLAGKKDQYFHGDAIEFLTDMLDDAKIDGYDIKIISAYRSFDEQQEVKGQFTQVYGSGSNAFSADQGYSEHQLGTTVDLTDPVTGGAYTSFTKTKEYQWLLDNAYRYGFVLSYPEGNNFYVFEPWHWRFVGRDLAKDIRRTKTDFYTWEQRKIDEYLVTIFD